jgi:hypothetical protein
MPELICLGASVKKKKHLNYPEAPGDAFLEKSTTVCSFLQKQRGVPTSLMKAGDTLSICIAN